MTEKVSDREGERGERERWGRKNEREWAKEDETEV